jgi:hypothetical protein
LLDVAVIINLTKRGIGLERERLKSEGMKGLFFAVAHTKKNLESQSHLQLHC